MLKGIVILGLITLLVVLVPVYAEAEAQYVPDREQLVRECDFARIRGTNIRPDRVFEMICWQNGAVILRETCLSQPDFAVLGDMTRIETRKYGHPHFIVPGRDAACLIRQMREE